MGQKPETMAEYHFNKDKSGRILRQWVDNSGFTHKEIADSIGMTEHMLNNSLYGKVQELSVERTFKIVTITGHSLLEYEDLMLEGDNIDFADLVRKLNRQAMLAALKTPEPSSSSSKPAEPVSDSMLDRFKRVYEGTIEQLRSQIQQLKESRELMREQYQQQLTAMERQHAAHNASMEAHHAEVTERLDREIERLHKQAARLRKALIIETSAIGLLFFADALVGDRGWILRSLLDVGGSVGTVIKKG